MTAREHTMRKRFIDHARRECAYCHRPFDLVDWCRAWQKLSESDRDLYVTRRGWTYTAA
ncbi:MAG: hypothetical protein GY851_29035 [bacterium]|nr:hypothetical protein [bacterium]